MIKRARIFQKAYLAVFLSAYGFVFLPLLKIDRNLDKHVSVLSKRLASVSGYKNIQSRNEYVRFEAEGVNDEQALSKIEELSQQAGTRLEYIDVKKPGAGNKPYMAVTPVVLSLSGPEHSLFNFLALIREAGFYSRLVTFSIKADTGDGTAARLQVEIEKAWHPGLVYVFRKKNSRSGLYSSGENRQLFKVFTAPAILKKNIAGRPDMIKDMALVGIIDDGSVKAVVEDRKAQKTFYLKIDDCVEDLCVTAIHESEIVLQNALESFNLTL